MTAMPQTRSLRLVAVSPELLLSPSVAIVGNSSALREARFGSEIDDHDEVIRFNGALTRGFEASVGARTTLQAIGIDIAYLFNPAYLRPAAEEERREQDRPENARRMVAFFPEARFLTFHPDDAARNAANRQYRTAQYLREVAPDLQLHLFEETGPGAFMTYYGANHDLADLGLEARLSHGGPRTGIKIVMRCVMSGIRPRLYGFDVDTSLEYARHYYDDVTKEPIADYKPHDIRGEMILLAELHRKGFVDIRS